MHETMNLQFRRTRIIHLIWIEKKKNRFEDVFVCYVIYFFCRPKVTKSWLIVGFLVSKSRGSQIALGSAERCWEPWERMKKPTMLVSSSFIYSLQSYTPTKQKNNAASQWTNKNVDQKVEVPWTNLWEKTRWTLMKIFHAKVTNGADDVVRRFRSPFPGLMGIFLTTLTVRHDFIREVEWK